MAQRRLEHFDEWVEGLKAELEGLLKQRAELETKIRHLSKKMELVRQMRALEQTPGVEQALIVAPSEVSEARATPQSVKETVRSILTESSRPLHISEIHRRFVDAGYPIPGGGTPFNILAHLVNDKGFVRVARGTYALAGSVPEEQIMPKSPRKKRKKSKRTRNRLTHAGT